MGISTPIFLYIHIKSFVEFWIGLGAKKFLISFFGICWLILQKCCPLITLKWLGITNTELFKLLVMNDYMQLQKIFGENKRIYIWLFSRSKSKVRAQYPLTSSYHKSVRNMKDLFIAFQRYVTQLCDVKKIC